VFSFGVMVAGFIVLSAYGWRDVIETDWTSLPMIVWITLLYVSIAASSITFVLLQFAVLRLPASKVMAYTYLVPSWVILWEIALGNGAPRGLVLGGIGLTVVALWMLLKDEG
jgi:drug/metabolite transporter (DMT)-like permease